jgi:hypothetical protein
MNCGLGYHVDVAIRSGVRMWSLTGRDLLWQHRLRTKEPVFCIKIWVSSDMSEIVHRSEIYRAMSTKGTISHAVPYSVQHLGPDPVQHGRNVALRTMHWWHCSHVMRVLSLCFTLLSSLACR